MSGRADEVVLIGGGGHALVAAEAALRAGFRLRGFLDDDEGARISISPHEPPSHLGPLERARGLAADCRLHLALGSLTLRRRLIGALGPEDGYATIIDPAATVLGTAEVGAGVLVAARAVVQSRAVVNAHAILNTGCIIEHECTIGENAHIAPGAVLGGRVRVGSDTLIGLGARLMPGVSVGRECVVGAGAVVTRDVPDAAKVAGVPARSIC